MAKLKVYVVCPNCRAKFRPSQDQRVPRHSRLMFGLCPGSGQAATVVS